MDQNPDPYIQAAVDRLWANYRRLHGSADLRKAEAEPSKPDQRLKSRPYLRLVVDNTKP